MKKSAGLWAGVAKIDITRRDGAGVDDPLYVGIDPAANDPLYVKALVLKEGDQTVVLIAVDAVAVAAIGSIGNEYMVNVREQLQRQLGIASANLVVNASHCHGIVCADVEQRTVEAVKAAAAGMVEVRVGTGVGYEDRIMENRRLRLKNGREADVRRAYALPPDAEVVGAGPVDPEIGVLRLDRLDGRPLAMVFNFACHPIQGVPGGGNTADISGFAASTIEAQLGHGAVAFFLQGCGADINPVRYKDTAQPRDAAPLGYMLGLSTLRALQKIRCQTAGGLQILRRTVDLPRADLAAPIAALEARQQELLQSLQGTELNLKSFIPLMVQYSLAPDFPSGPAHRYWHEKSRGREDLATLDAANRQHLERYMNNIHIMEELTRVQINLGLLQKHQAQNLAAGTKTVAAEVMGLRLGDFVLVTFPGELPVQIGLDIKQRSPHQRTFVAGVTNGYLYYTPTVAQLKNQGGAQEDSDCLLAPAWQQLFEATVDEILAALSQAS